MYAFALKIAVTCKEKDANSGSKWLVKILEKCFN